MCHRLIVWKRTRKQTKFGKTTWKQRLKHANVIQFSVSVILLFFSYVRYHILPMYNLHLLINLSCVFFTLNFFPRIDWVSESLFFACCYNTILIPIFVLLCFCSRDIEKGPLQTVIY